MIDKDKLRIEFSKRLNSSLDNAGVRAHGRGVDIQDALKRKGLKTSTESIRKWLSGLSIPSIENMKALAEIAKVSTSWLQFGESVSKPLTKPHDFELIGEISEWDDETPLDEDEVEVPFFKEVELSAGCGKTEVIELTDRKLRFSKRTLRDAGVSPKDVACARVSGNSMERLIIDGATIGIDTSEKSIVDGEIYAFDHDGMLRVKYLYKMPGGAIRLRSENSEEYGDEIISPEKLSELRILGWVFWWSIIRRKKK